MERYDIAIVGNGPAGVSAAITSKIRNKKIVLFGSNQLSDKVGKAHEILNYTGLPRISGEELNKNLKKHLADLDIEITEKKINMVYSMGDHFNLQAGEEFIEATSVILAGGVVMEKALEGENEFLGKGVSYCATCDAQFYKGKTVGVLGYNEESVEEALYLAEIVDKVLYFPMKNETKDLIAKASLPDNLSVVEEEIADLKNLAIKSENQEGFMRKVSCIETKNNKYEMEGVFVLRDAVAPDKLVPGIELDGNHVKVNLSMETNIPGLFACGDIAGKPYQYIKAAGQGNVAALSAVSYLNTGA